MQLEAADLELLARPSGLNVARRLRKSSRVLVVEDACRKADDEQPAADIGRRVRFAALYDELEPLLVLVEVCTNDDDDDNDDECLFLALVVKLANRAARWSARRAADAADELKLGCCRNSNVPIRRDQTLPGKSDDTRRRLC